jgi:indolepyruvate ferredoxin oxidoreductase, beta subunit
MDAQVTREVAREVTSVRPITIAIVALGGEGGGVLADWIVDLAEHGGYLAQATRFPASRRAPAQRSITGLFDRTPGVRQLYLPVF